MPTNEIVIKPTTDLFIAALWSAPKNEPILRSLLNAVMTDIGQPVIVKATVLNPFNIQDRAVDKQIRLDVLVEDETGAIYNIEVQTDSHKGFFDRMLYYWAEIYGTGLQRSERYEDLRPVHSIVITEFSVFRQLKQLHAVFEIRARENPAVLLSTHFQMHVLRLGDLLRNNLSGLDDLCKDLQRWMQFWAFGKQLEENKMNAILHDSPDVLQAYEEYKRFTADTVMWEKIKERERFLIDQRLLRGYAIREGREEGREEGKIETARNLKRLGVPAATIAEATGLSLTEIERLD
ncbi:MAG: Rpn family recombination-promoting nuclease/putative transposase [Planctomycetaceae bacterium]|nr:Rpn family recombination-promoting nuclease/putative transposase [Planctomycetaceae bacterium]